MGQTDEDMGTLADKCVESSSACSSTANSNNNSKLASPTKTDTIPQTQDQVKETTTATTVKPKSQCPSTSSSSSSSSSSNEEQQEQTISHNNNRSCSSHPVDDDISRGSPPLSPSSSPPSHDFRGNIPDASNVNIQIFVDGIPSEEKSHKDERQGEDGVVAEQLENDEDSDKEILRQDYNDNDDDDNDNVNSDNGEDEDNHNGEGRAKNPQSTSRSRHDQKTEDQHHNHNHHKRGFGLVGRGFGLSKVFHHHRSSSQSSTSTERLVLLNNQIVMSANNGCSVSKSSSESNIPMCHNSLDNLADALDLPSSRSTDSSCLLTDPDSDDIDIRRRIIKNNSDGHFGNNEQRNSHGEQSSTSSSSSSSNMEEHDSSSGGGSSSCESGNIAGNNHNHNNNNNNKMVVASEIPPRRPTTGPKYKLIVEGDIQVCKVKHGQNLMSKLTSVRKYLRRWETHHLYLNDSCISSKTPIGCLSTPVSYWQMEEVYVVVRWDSGRRYVIRIVLPDGSLLLQASNAYVRDQWYHSIIWKKNIFKYHNLMRSSKRPEFIIKELKALVDFATVNPLQDDCISHVPIEIVSNLLDSQAGELLGKRQVEEVLLALSPLLERSHPPPSLCRFFSRHCRTRPRCPLVDQLFTPVVRRALKHNVDFGKYPYMRLFIQDFIVALNCHNDGINVVRNFVKSMHGPASSCPHPRVMSNLVSVCLAAIFAIFERNNTKRASHHLNSETSKDIPWDERLLCYLAVFDTISEFDDWRPSLASLLQPVPFPEDALANPLFTRSISSVIRRIGTDNRCDVHQMVMGIRDAKKGWFHLFSPSNLACFDDGELWGAMLGRLLSCCCRRKRFLVELGGKELGSCLLLALREHGAAQDALCLLLEWKVVHSEDQRVQIATTLQSTPQGRTNYAALCSRQLHLKELQQKGGPRKLTLPSRSTDTDLAKLLSCGSFGNLECLSLAFTQVTSACAEQLIKLPSLRYLNLWSTNFADAGLHLISEHLPNLQVLNLCETPVSDKGLIALTCMTSLRKLNLNSTHLSAQTFANLKQKLPALKEVDVRYTEAW